MKPFPKQQVAGYTLLELIVVLVMAAVLAAIAAPSWLAFLNRQRLSVAQSEVVTAMREAQANAKRQKRNWEVCFQDSNGKVRWTVRPSLNSTDPLNCATTDGLWKDLTESDSQKIRMEPTSPVGVRFRPNGWIDTQTPPADPDNDDVTQVTLMLRNQSGGSKRCVFVATMLGAVRTANDSDCNP